MSAFKPGDRVEKVVFVPGNVYLTGTKATVVSGHIPAYALAMGFDAMAIIDVAGDDGAPCDIRSAHWRRIDGPSGQTFTDTMRELGLKVPA